MEAPSLETPQARLDGALSTLIQLMSLLAAGGLDWMASESPFHPKAFCDSKFPLFVIRVHMVELHTTTAENNG